MDRRTYLGGLTTAGVLGFAGCLDSVEEAAGLTNEGEGNWGSNETVLSTPEEDRGNPSHPIYGHEMPTFSMPDPLSGKTVDTAAFEGDRSYLMTFIFTACPDGACPALLLRLRRAQEDAREHGYEDDVSFLAMTFDPERDTPDVLETYADERGIDHAADNWHFLRPETYEAGETLLDDKFGMQIERVEDEDEIEEIHEGHDHEDEHDGHDGNETGGHDHDEHDHDDYTFVHFNLILLVNEHGVVERSYPGGDTVDTDMVVEDVRAVTGN